MEKIANTGVRNWKIEQLARERAKWRTRLLSMGMFYDAIQMNDAIERVEGALKNVLQDPTGLWILSDEHAESATELKLTGQVNGQFVNVILDRTFVASDGVRWIIDYKTGTTGGNVKDFLDAEVGRYRDQLNSYRAVFSGMEKRTIKTALYFPAVPEWREVQTESNT